MRIKSLHIHNFRALGSLDLDDLPDTGVVLISGENEKGKSTILEAVRTVLTTKAKSTAKGVKALKTIGGTEPPEVRLRAQVGEYEFEVYKRFVNRPTTSLQIIAPRPANYSDSEAEDTLERILASNLDPQLRDAMFITPEGSGLKLKAAMIGSLTAALDQRAGGDSGSDSSGIIAAVEKEAERYYSPKNQKPSKELKAAEDALASAIEARAQAEATVADLEEAVSNVERYTVRKDSAESELPQAEEMLSAATTELGTATTAAEVVERASEELGQARMREEIAREKRDARAQRVEALAEADAELAQLGVQLEEATERRQEELKLVEQAKEALRAAHAEQEEARSRRQEAIEVARLASVRDALDKNRAVLAELDSLKVPEAEVEEISPDEVAAISKAAQELEVATAVLHARATTVSLRADSARTIERDGAAVELGEEPVEDYLTRPTELTIDGVHVTISPGGNVDEAEVTRARETLGQLLGAAGCASAEDAEARLAAWREYESQRRAVELQRKGLLRDRSLQDLEEQIARAKVQLDGVGELPGLPVAKEQVEQAEQAQSAADAKVTNAQAASNGLAAQPAAQDLARLEATVAATRSRADKERASLAELEEGQPMDGLEKDLADAAEAVAAKEQALEAARAAAGASDLELAQGRFDAATAKVESVRARIEDASAQLLRLEGVIALAEGSAETLEKAKSREEAARTRRDQVLRRAKAARLLLETLLAHREEARKKYHEPFLKELQLLARPVFGPGVSFTLNDDLDVESRTIDGATVAVGELSSGAREQLALLTRFAVARLISDEGVPIFIDDQLGSTDDLRLMHMGSVLRQLGSTEQVLIFSCAPSRFDYIRDLDVREMSDIATY